MNPNETNEVKQPTLILTEAEKLLWAQVYSAVYVAMMQNNESTTENDQKHSKEQADASIMAIRARSAPAQIDALLPTEPATARVPDTTTVERERCAAVAKRHLCISGNKFAQDVARSILSEIINPDHVVGSDRKPDHIPDAGEKVELPGKWTVRAGDGDKDSIYFGGMESDTGAFVDFAAFALDDVEADKIISAANKLRELTFAAAFRAGIEAAAKVSEQNHIGKFQTWTKHQASVTATLIRAIPTPALD